MTPGGAKMPGPSDRRPAMPDAPPKPHGTPHVEHYDKPAGGATRSRAAGMPCASSTCSCAVRSTLLSHQPARRLRLPGLRLAGPQRHTSTFEFCENGVKAVAAEATSQARHAGVLRRAHRAELAPGRPTTTLEAQGRLTEPMVYDAASDRYVPDRLGRRVRADRRARCNALASPDEAIFYTSGRTSNEAAFLYQLFVREFGTNNLPDCSNMCHEPSGVALAEQIGSRQGHGHAGRLRAGRRDLHLRPEPRHQPSAHARRAARAPRKRGARSSRSTRCASAGLERFADPQEPAEMLAGGSTRIASRLLPAAHRRRPRRRWRPASWLEGDVRRRAATRARPRLHRRAHAPASRSFAARPARRADWDAHRARVAAWRAPRSSSAAQVYIDSRARPSPAGAWASPSTGTRRHDPDARQPAAAARQHRPPGRGRRARCAGTATCRATARWASTRSPPPAFLDRLGDVFGFEPPRAHGLRHRRRHRGDARRPRQGVLRDGRQLRRRHARHARHRSAALRRCDAHRARQHQAQPQPPGARARGADPAVPGPHRDRRAGRRPAGRDGGGLDEHGAPVGRA